MTSISARLGFRPLLGAGLIVFTAGAAAAAQLHVAPAGSDDAGKGSPASPYREIRKAVSAAAPGDAILVADGQYKGFTVRDLHGTANAPIAIRAQGRKAEVLKTTDRPDNRDTMYLDGCSYIVIDGLVSSNANRAAIRLEGSHHIIVRNGVFGNNANWGIFTGHCDDLLIETNECFGSAREHGIYVSNSGDRPVIRGNRSHDNAGCGIHMNGDLSCGGDGIISGALVEYNVIFNNGRRGGGGINMDGVQDSVIRNNLLYNNHATGITCYRGDGAAGPKGQKILHNTIVMAADARYALQLGQTAGPNLVRNNILYDLNPARGGLACFDGAADVPNVDSDGNVFSAEAPIVALDDWKTRMPLAQWQAQGRDRHSVVASAAALFVDAARGNYHLAAGSPATGKGVALADAPRDAEGRPRSPKTPDIGCFESAPAGR